MRKVKAMRLRLRQRYALVIAWRQVKKLRQEMVDGEVRWITENFEKQL